MSFSAIGVRAISLDCWLPAVIGEPVGQTAVAWDG